MEIKEFKFNEAGVTIEYEGGGSTGTCVYKHTIDVTTQGQTFEGMFEILNTSSDTIDLVTDFVTDFDTYITMKATNPSDILVYNVISENNLIFVCTIDKTEGTGVLQLDTSMTIVDHVTLF